MHVIAAFFSLIFLATIPLRGAKNKYEHFTDLQQNELEGIDYQIKSLDRQSEITIFAIHGGLIEPVTSEIAIEISQPHFNYYLFEGIKTQNNWDLHISSHQFDEPLALEFSRRSRLCISIHGFEDSLHNKVCLGGLNSRVRRSIFRQLKAEGIIDQNDENPCNNYKATSANNIVNRCQENGVQIEISGALRDQLRSNRHLMKIFANAVKLGILSN